MDKIKLDKLPLGIRHVDDMSVIRDAMTIENYTDTTLNQLVTQIRTFVLAEEIDRRERVVKFDAFVPINWWHHFKQDKFPAWLKRMSPVKYRNIGGKRKVIFRRLATYPKANIAVPELGDVVIYRNEFKEDLA